MVLHQTFAQMGRNFVSKEFDTFCKDLGIVLNFSSRYHHSANQAEHAIRMAKDLIKRCDSAGAYWRIALLEFLYTPGPDGVSPSSLMSRQFRAILPMLEKGTNNDVYSEKFSDKKLKEKEKFNDKYLRKLKPLLVGSTMSDLNSDLKTWNVGVVVAHSPDNRSYHVRMESGTVISHNRIHLRLTNVNFALQQPVHQTFQRKFLQQWRK